MKVSNGKVFACICFEEIAITNEARRLETLLTKQKFRILVLVHALKYDLNATCLSHFLYACKVSCTVSFP